MRPVALEDEDDGQEKEGKVKKATTSRGKIIQRKLEKLKMKRCLNQYLERSSSGFDMGAVYELKIRKLKTNNRALAKALAEKKEETQQWYREVISLKGELQEAQEQLLRATDNDFQKTVELKVEKRLREHCEPINAAISTTMENVLMVVEGLTKAKQLAGRALNSFRNRSSVNSSSGSLPRPLGARLPLGATSNNISPRQSVVLPMVSGHVLQPAMVAIPKLDMMWSRKMQERSQAREDEGLEMTVIGEQSSNIEDEGNTSDSMEEEAEVLQEGVSPCKTEIEEHSDSLLNLCSDGENKLSISPQRTRSRTRTSLPDEITESESQEDDIQHEVGETPDKQEGNEDPLEGPSWLFSESVTNRSSCSAKGRGRGGRRGKLKTNARCTSLQSRNSVVVESSDSEEDNGVSTLKNSKVTSFKKPLEIADFAKENSTNSLEHSYLASPATMFARLEDLEAKAGRQSKRSKGRSLRANRESMERVHDVIPEKQLRSSPRSKELLRGMNNSAVAKTDESLNLHLDATVGSSSNTEPLNDSHPQDTVHMPPPILPGPTKQAEFWVNDNDLTCVHNISMDMTEPISKIFAQAAVEALKEEKGKEVQLERRFFKAESNKQLKVQPEVAEKTPFDVSQMDATLVNIPPYSSQRTVEKENLPPQFENHSNADAASVMFVNLRRVSVVLEDVLKSPRSTEKFTPQVNLALSSGSGSSRCSSSSRSRNKQHQKSTAESPMKSEPVRRKMLTYSLQIEEDDKDLEDSDDEAWIPSGIRKSKTCKRRNTTTGKVQGRNSSVGRKRSATDIVPERLKKVGRKKKYVNSSESPRTTPDISLDDKNGETVDHDKEDKRGDKALRNVIVDKTVDSESTTPNIMADCYVKVHRASLKNIRDSVTNPEESLLLKLDDSNISLSPILPSKSTEDQTKKAGKKQATGIQVDQSPISDGTQDVNTEVQQRKKVKENAGGTQEREQTDDEDKSNETLKDTEGKMRRKTDRLQSEKQADIKEGEQLNDIMELEQPNHDLDLQRKNQRESARYTSGRVEKLKEVQSEGLGTHVEEALCRVNQIDQEKKTQDDKGQEGKNQDEMDIKKKINAGNLKEPSEKRLKAVTEITEPDGNIVNEGTQRRKRRAASKITSFKEMSLISKMRQESGNTVVCSTHHSRKSGRRSATN
ncbi:ELKS/Rab6-interacting/CAST family member 1 isoform X2 [Procambarus clarkii]|uniref:ELKS/Rab6-interacting/CAST family member 1 isoform X2 n=1 Tax=Procambarus clarkii TaxID=6728 RepID=UPI0037427B74